MFLVSFISKQNGVSLLQSLLVLTVCVVLALAAVALLPVYVQSYTAEKIIQGIADQSASEPLNTAAIKRDIIKGLEINNIETIFARDISVVRQDDAWQVHLEYEVREHFMYNIDFLLSFKKQVQLPRAGERQ